MVRIVGAGVWAKAPNPSDVVKVTYRRIVRLFLVEIMRVVFPFFEIRVCRGGGPDGLQYPQEQFQSLGRAEKALKDF
jgi:hypothetical protein